MNKIFKTLRYLKHQPTAHFFVLGCLLFLLHKLVAPPDLESELIVVSPQHVETLRESLARQLGRAPRPDELESRIQRYIDKEVLYREALALGLDQGDTVVMRRLIQKMEFLLDDLAVVPEPSDEELEAILAEEEERFRLPARATIEHVFLGGTQNESSFPAQASQALARLRLGGDPRAEGHPFVLGRRFVGRSQSQLAAVLGSALAEAVFEAPTGQWMGPYSSRYGQHLVRVEERQPGRQPELAQVRNEVLRLWLEERREEANRQARERLRQRYSVRVEMPADDQSEVASSSEVLASARRNP